MHVHAYAAGLMTLCAHMHYNISYCRPVQVAARGACVFECIVTRITKKQHACMQYIIILHDACIQ